MEERTAPKSLESSRQNSADSDSASCSSSTYNTGVRGKDLVHKCHSDPGGGGVVSRLRTPPPRPARHRSTGGSTRKCVLTLDGYSYVIGEYLVHRDLRSVLINILIEGFYF